MDLPGENDTNLFLLVFMYKQQARGTEHESRGFFSTAKHFYNASMLAYSSALSRSPCNARLLRNTGEVVFKLGRYFFYFLFVLVFVIYRSLRRLDAAISQKKRNLSMVNLSCKERKSWFLVFSF